MSYPVPVTGLVVFDAFADGEIALMSIGFKILGLISLECY